MRVEEKIVEYVKPLAGDLTIENVIIGMAYTGVTLSNGKGGLAFSFRNLMGHTCGVMKKPGTICGTPVTEALDWVMGDNIAAAAIGTACINAILNQGYQVGPEISKTVHCNEDDVVGMVGWFCPLVKKYQNAKEFYIFEQDYKNVKSTGIEQILPDSESVKYLPKCNKVVMTGTSFINKTMDELLSACNPDAEIILVGASTPMCPEVFKDYHVTYLAGAQVTDVEGMMHVVAEGGGGRDLFRISEKLLEKVD